MTGAEAGHDATTHVHGTGAVQVPATTLAGWSAELADDQTRMDVLEKAFDFRGDCTLTLDDSSVIAGYIFDRRAGATLGQSVVRLLTPTSDEKVTIAYSRICKVEFGKDTAAGKSFETWIKKYVEKKLKGEKASIESEAL